MSVAKVQIPGGDGALLQARSIAIAATLVTMTCALAAIPLAAFGDDTAAPNGPTPEQAELLDVREDVEQINEEAVAEAPVQVGSSCRATIDVEGIGDACRTPDGLLRVEQADGRSHTIHGLDAPPIAAASYAPGSQAAVSGAGPDDVTCVAGSEQHYTLVYARPGNVASRFTTIAPLLKTEVYKLSAYIDAESRSVDPAAGRRLPVRCDGGPEPVVLQATLGELSAGTASFSDIVNGLRAQGYQFNGDQGSTERYIVYWDAPSSSGAAGTGHVFTSDASAGPGNQNNKGGLYSVEYRYTQGGGVPHWDVLVHEVMHTMGAVVGAAPHSTSAGHCRDGQDIMCYDDTGTGAYQDNVCATKVLDCNRDDYFNPAPGGGTYLATHWNAAAAYNAWLRGWAASGTPVGDSSGSEGTETRTPRDATPPTQPGRVSVKQHPGRITLRWTGSRDNVAIRNFQVRRVVKTKTRTRYVVMGTTRGRAITVRARGMRPGLRYRLQVVARDGAGNVSAPRTVMVRVLKDTKRPSRVKRVRAVARSSSTVTLRWTPSRDNVELDDYVVARKVGRKWHPVAKVPSSRRVVRVRRLSSSRTYAFRVQARDTAGNRSIPSKAVRARTKSRSAG